MKKIILIETSDVGARPTAEAVQRLGFEPVFLVNLNNYQGDTLAQVQAFEHYQVDTSSFEAMETWLAGRDWEIEAITTFLDSRLHLAIALAKRFGVRGLEDRLLPFKDKGYVESLAADVCPPSLSFNLEQIPRDEIERLRAKFPAVILKPRCTAGGLGTRVFSREEPFENLVWHIHSYEIPAHLSPGEWMVQVFIEGELISVEGFVEHGNIHQLGISGRRKVGNTESWVGFPYDERLGSETCAKAYDQVEKLLLASELRNCFFHIELMANADGAYVIDANIGRMGGGGIGEVLATAYGVSTTELFCEVLRITLYLGGPPASFWKRTPAFAISVAYGLHETCDLKSLRLPSHNLYHTQILSTGIVPGMGADNWGWVGIASGSENQVRNFLAQVQAITSEGVRPACYALEDMAL